MKPARPTTRSAELVGTPVQFHRKLQPAPRGDRIAVAVSLPPHAETATEVSLRLGVHPEHGLPLDTIAAREVFDVQGAGDTTIAALWLARLAGASLLEAAVIANAAAGVVVGKIGTATAGPEEVRALLPEAIEAARAGLRGGTRRHGREE